MTSTSPSFDRQNETWPLASDPGRCRRPTTIDRGVGPVTTFPGYRYCDRPAEPPGSRSGWDAV